MQILEDAIDLPHHGWPSDEKTFSCLHGPTWNHTSQNIRNTVSLCSVMSVPRDLQGHCWLYMEQKWSFSVGRHRETRDYFSSERLALILLFLLVTELLKFHFPSVGNRADWHVEVCSSDSLRHSLLCNVHTVVDLKPRWQTLSIGY